MRVRAFCRPPEGVSLLVMLPKRDHMNLFVVLILFFSVALLSYFIVALMGSAQWGEVAGALGNVVGGMVGAAAAVLVVFLTLSRQRQEESDKVSAAVRTERARESIRLQLLNKRERFIDSLARRADIALRRLHVGVPA